MLARLTVTLPPLPEQKAIASILSSLDDKIELNRRMNETLEAMARAIFKDWFVDFGPTRAKQEGRAAYLPEQLWSLFPEAIDEETGLPQGWEEKPVGHLLISSIGGDWGKEQIDNKHTELVAIIRGTDFSSLKNGNIGSIPNRYVEKKKLDKRLLCAGDILLEVSGGSPTQPTGRNLYIASSILERFNTALIPASFCRRFRPLSYEIASLLTLHLDTLYEEGGTWEYQNQSTGRSNFQTTYFLESEMVVLPSQDILKNFHNIVNPILNKMFSNENMVLSELRDRLLPKLMSGEIRVKDAEKLVEEVM
jgi:type I restriction enzyme S subunit